MLGSYLKTPYIRIIEPLGPLIQNGNAKAVLNTGKDCVNIGNGPELRNKMVRSTEFLYL